MPTPARPLPHVHIRPPTASCPGTSAPHPIRGTVPYCTCEFKRLAAGSPGLQALWARLSGPCLTLWHMWLATGALTSACKHLTSLRSQHIVRNGAPCARRNHHDCVRILPPHASPSAPLHPIPRACRPQAGMDPSYSAAASLTSPDTARERRPPVQMPNSFSKLLF